MMTTTPACRQMARFVDELPLRLRTPAETAAARRHAEGCEVCGERLAEAEALERDLGALPTIAPSARMRDAVLARLAASAPDRAPADAATTDATGSARDVPARDVPARDVPVPGAPPAGPRARLAPVLAAAGGLLALGGQLMAVDLATTFAGLVSIQIGSRIGPSIGGLPFLIAAAGTILIALATLETGSRSADP